MSDPKRLSVIRNTSLNYLGQAYALLIGILILPFYLGHLGAEAYGLIGFRRAAGLAAIARCRDVAGAGAAVAHYRGQGDLAAGRGPAGRLLRSFELLLLPIALLACLTIYRPAAGSPRPVAGTRAEHRDHHELHQPDGADDRPAPLRDAVQERPAGRGTARLAECGEHADRHTALLRRAVPVAYVSKEPLDFFLFQTAVAGGNLRFRQQGLCTIRARAAGRDRLEVVRPVLPFAGGMCFTSLLWIALTQLDKVLLSRCFCSGYGYFSLVALITTGIMTLTNPLVQTILPRMTMLVAEGRIADMERLYLNASRFVCSVLFPLATVIAWHGQALIFLDRRPAAAQWSERLLFWYVPGSALMAVGAFQFYLQYAYGQLRLHIWYSVISTAISMPIVIYAALVHGAYGAALAWFFLRLATFLIWPPVVHRRFAPRLNGVWMGEMLRITAMTVLGLLIGAPLFEAIVSDNRFDILLALATSGAVCLLLVAASSKHWSTSFIYSSPSEHPKMELKSEQALIERWGGKTEPLLSIVCLTYNHAPSFGRRWRAFSSRKRISPSR